MSYMTRNLLPLNLQFFAEDAGGAGDTWVDAYSGDTSTESTGTKQESTTTDESMIPKKRFDDINNRYKALNDDYKNRQAEYDDMVKQLEDGKSSSKQLQDTIDAGNKRVEALETVIKGMLDAELEQIDEEYRELVPADKAVEEQLDWLRKAKQKGLFGSRGMEFEIGQPSNPQRGSRKSGTEGMNPLQLLTMGYSN